MEEWKILKTFDTTGRRFVEGDVIYISNKGRIKLNDEILEIGKGLYVDTDGQIHIVGVSYGEHTTLYRWIYYNFIGEYKKGCGYNIHHIDGNHLNNAADNLIQLSAYRHGKLHDEQYNELYDTIMSTKKKIKQYAANKDIYISNGIKYFKNRVTEYKAAKKLAAKQQRTQQTEQRREQRRKKCEELKQLKQKQLIEAGTHFLCKDGRLMSYQQIQNMHAAPRDNSYITDEWKQQMSNIIKQLSIEGKNTGRASTPEKELERREKIRKKMLGKQNARKNYIVIG